MDMENIQTNSEALRDMPFQHAEAGLLIAIMQDVVNENQLITSVIIRGNRNSIINALIRAMEDDSSLFEITRDAVAICSIREEGGHYVPSAN